MSDTVRGIMASATKALFEASLEDAEEALTAADSLKEIRERCEHRSMQLLARENPVATELRQVFTSIYIVEDFSRMGALAKHVANTARLRYPRRSSISNCNRRSESWPKWWTRWASSSTTS